VKEENAAGSSEPSRAADHAGAAAELAFAACDIGVKNPYVAQGQGSASGRDDQPPPLEEMPLQFPSLPAFCFPPHTCSFLSLSFFTISPFVVGTCWVSHDSTQPPALRQKEL
jgi:hypothetical protein